jgi:hypothetical protein
MVGGLQAPTAADAGAPSAGLVDELKAKAPQHLGSGRELGAGSDAAVVEAQVLQPDAFECGSSSEGSADSLCGPELLLKKSADVRAIAGERSAVNAVACTATFTKLVAAATTPVQVAVLLQVSAAGDATVSLRYEIYSNQHPVPVHIQEADAVAENSLQRADAAGADASPAARSLGHPLSSPAAKVVSVGEPFSGNAARRGSNRDALDACREVHEELPTPCSLAAGSRTQIKPSAEVLYSASRTRQRNKKNVPVVLRGLIPPPLALPAPLLAPVSSRPIYIALRSAPPWTKFSGPPPRTRDSRRLRPLHSSPSRTIDGPQTDDAIPARAVISAEAQSDATPSAHAAARASLCHAQPIQQQFGLGDDNVFSHLPMREHPSPHPPMDVHPPAGQCSPSRPNCHHAAKFDEAAYVRELVLGPRNRAAIC